MQRFHATHVSASEEGDHFQILFEESSEQEDHPYLLVQRQFETPDGGRCYIETENCDFAGHFRIRSARLGRSTFRLIWGRISEEAAEVTFEADDSTFAEIGKVLRIMVPSAEVTDEEGCYT